MEVVICYCSKCSSELGRFRNSWIGIGITYYSPVYPMLTSDSGFHGFGDPFASQAQSQIENCMLQDLYCKKCQTLLGLRCDRAPEGHALIKDQLILRRGQMSVISDITGGKAKPVVVKTLSLTTPGSQKHTLPKRASTVQPIGRKSSNTQTENNGFHSSFGSMPPPPSKKPVPDFSEFKSWAHEAIGRQQKDINRISGTLQNFEQQMHEFSTFMAEVRTEMAANRELRQKQEQDRENLVQLAREVGLLQDQVITESHTAQGKSGESLSKDIEIIISDMLQVSEKANEVDGVRLDLDNLRTKLQNMGDVTQLRLELQDLKGHLHYLRKAVKQAPERPSTGVTSASDQARSGTEQRFPRVEIYSQPPETRSLKRKHAAEHATTISADQAAIESRLPKRRRVSARNFAVDHTLNDELNEPGQSRVRFQSPRSDDIQSLSTKHQGFVLSSDKILPERSNYAEETVDVDVPTAAKAMPRSSSKDPGDGTGAHSLRRTASMTNLSALSRASAQDTTRQESMKPGRRSSVSNGKGIPARRDTQGFLINPSGKIGGWSLRLRKETSNKENETPIQANSDNDNVVSLNKQSDHASERVEKASTNGSRAARLQPRDEVTRGVNKKLSGHILPSIENDDCELQAALPEVFPSDVIDLTYGEEEHQNLSKSASRKPFPCTNCGKGYISAQGLTYHERNSICGKDEATEQMKKAKLTAREKLVKDIMAREMAVGI